MSALGIMVVVASAVGVLCQYLENSHAAEKRDLRRIVEQAEPFLVLY